MTTGLLSLLAVAALSTTDPIPSTDIVWLRLPTGEEISAMVPRRSLPAPPGRIVMACTIVSSGRLTDCKVSEEAPEGFGYGAVAIKVARYFTAGPVTKSGLPTVGRRVSIPMVFKTYGGEATP